jgi:tetratricopeptide (TPR) repeat protein
MDVDTMEPGVDFVTAVEYAIGSCDVLIAVIGKRWLNSAVEEIRRIDNQDDSVRLEIATALKREIRVIPVLVDGASMPRSSDLPDDLKLLARRNALEVSHNRFDADFGRLVEAIERVWGEADGKRQPEETGGPEAEWQREGKARLEAQRREATERELQEANRREIDAEAAFNRGIDSGNKKDHDKAISDFSEAIRIKPDFDDAYHYRGYAYDEKS